MPSKGHQTIKDVQIPIPISNNQDLRSQPYTFEFMYNAVDSPYIDFSNSYLELHFKVTGSGSKVTRADQICNIYAIIDKITTDLVYVSPTGQDIAVNYSESSIDSSMARKFVILKELSKDEIDKSMYASCEQLYARELPTLQLLDINYANMSNDYQLFIPLMLITGLGTFDCAIKVKTLKMQFVTNYLSNLMKANSDEITQFALSKVFMNFRQIYDINFGNDPKALIKCIPNNCQISTYTKTLTIEASSDNKGNLLVNRSVNFVPDYAMLYFTDSERSMIPINTETITTLQFQIGGQNIYSKTDFPTAYRYIGDTYQTLPVAEGSKIYTLDFDRNTTTGVNTPKTAPVYKKTPNPMFYNTWRSNSNPQSVLDATEWYKQPIYLFPVSSVVDVNTRSGCEVNISLVTEYIGGEYNGKKVSDGVDRTIYVHFIFVKFVRDGAMN